MFDFKKTGQLQKQRFRLRAWVAGVVVLAGFGLLTGRLWQLQVDRHEGLAARADRNRIAVVPVPPRRGEIVDRNGEVLARNYRSYTLEVVPAHVEDIDAMLDALRQVVYVSPAEQRRFKRRVAESSRYASVLLRNNLNDTEAAWFAAHAFRFPGVELKARWVREYPQGTSAAHVLGYIGRISEADLQALDEEGVLGNYRGTDVIGKKGLEKTWEQVLHGRTGLEEVEVTATGRPVRTLRRIDPVPGANLVLSLDMGLQRVAEQAFEGRRGALVAIEPATVHRQAHREESPDDQVVQVAGDPVAVLHHGHPGQLGARAVELVEQPRVGDRRARDGGEAGDDALVVLAEAALLVREVEVADDLPVHAQRQAQERLHRRVTGWEADRGRVLGEVVQAYGRTLLEDHPQHAAAAGRGADRRGHLVADPLGDELGQLVLRVGAQDGECGVPGAGQLTRLGGEAAQQVVVVELGGDRHGRLDDLLPPSIVLHGPTVSPGPHDRGPGKSGRSTLPIRPRRDARWRCRKGREP